MCSSTRYYEDISATQRNLAPTVLIRIPAYLGEQPAHTAEDRAPDRATVHPNQEPAEPNETDTGKHYGHQAQPSEAAKRCSDSNSCSHALECFLDGIS